MKINIYYWNNGVGVLTDSILFKTILSDFDVIVYDVSKNNQYRESDIGIFIQNIWVDYLNHNKKNVYIIHEEWLNPDEISYLNQFDLLIVKSNHAKQLLSSYHRNIINVGSCILTKKLEPTVTGNILHFKGKSIQKNHELSFKYQRKYNINVVDSETKYLSESEVIHNLNNHDIHICCSLYEAWGHYAWEAMSCGKLVICSEIPVFKEFLDPELVKFIPIYYTSQYDPEYRFLNNKNYKFRTGYFVDEIIFQQVLDEKDKLLEFQQKNSDNIIKFVKNVMDINKTKFIDVIKNII